jgi:uncharacterized protein
VPPRTPRELAVAVLDAMAAYDGAALAPLLAADVTWWTPPSARDRGIDRPLVGRERVVELLTGGLGLFRAGTITWTAHQIVADDEHVAVGFTRRSLTADGRPYENEYCFVFRHVDGQVREGWEHADTAHATAQLGR